MGKDTLDENGFLLQHSSLGTAVNCRIWRAASTHSKVCGCENRQYRVKKFYAVGWGFYSFSYILCPGSVDKPSLGIRVPFT